MLFNVWNPARVNGDAVTFDVTRANMPRVHRGDREWIAACLEAIDVSAAPRDWSVQAARCFFYSDYTDEAEWLDRWPDTWMIRVELDGAPPADFGPPDPLPKLVDRYDSTWTHGHVDPGHDRVALLPLLIGEPEQDAARIRDDLLASLPPGIAIPSTTIAPAGSEATWLRLTFTGSHFPEAVEPLELFLTQCRDRGIAVNRNDLP